IQHSVVSLKCYTCQGGVDGCGTSFNPKASGVIIVEDSGNIVCKKIVATSNQNAVQRGPGTTSCTTYTTVSVAFPPTPAATHYCCDTDLCNGAQIKSGSLILGLALATMAFFYFK
ncbi:unnamed protein product, partial [Adineta ricciae]